MNRREFLKWVGVGSGATLAGCDKRDREGVVSFFVAPENWIPGHPMHFASTCMACPSQCGIVAKAYEKAKHGTVLPMPIKLEGAAGHPINDGRLCMRGQASITRMYQADRIQQPMEKGKPISWDQAYAKILDELQKAKASNRRSEWLSGHTTGALSELIGRFCEAFGVRRRPDYEPATCPEIREANGIVFGRAEVPRYAIEKADFLLTIGADLIETFVSPVENMRGIQHAKERHHLEWIHVEPYVSLTGANAGKRFGIKPGSEPHLLAWLLRRLRLPLPAELDRLVPEIQDSEAAARTGLNRTMLETIAKGLEEAKQPLVIAGGVSTAHAGGSTVAVLAALLQLGKGMNQTVLDFSSSWNFDRAGGPADLRALADDLKSGKSGVLFLSRTNPLGTVPASTGFKDGVARASYKVALADFLDETAKECDLVLPLAHFLESWGDAQPRRDVRSIVQPIPRKFAMRNFTAQEVQDKAGKDVRLFTTRGMADQDEALPIVPEARAEGDILLGLIRTGTGTADAANFRDYVLAKLDAAGGRGAYLAGGFQPSKPAAARFGPSRADEIEKHLRREAFQRPLDGLTLVLAPTVRGWDGGARLPLLSEIPDPLTTITWGHWVSVGEEFAKKEGLETGSEVTLEATGWKATLPVKIQQGLNSDVLVIEKGPFDAQLPGAGLVEKVTLAKTGTVRKMPIMSGSESQQGRGIIPMSHVHPHDDFDRSNRLYPKHKHHPYRWAMAIDLEKCTGCGACVAACYVENNVPITGNPADQNPNALRNDHVDGREMSWLRIEPFYENGSPEFIPMLCQHCDNAPCETVCPVFAAYHTTEGLNGQVYNRCVGTRYCSNNCPYKVRRFNWWENFHRQPLVSMSNPELAVRPRGTMEKCTFCVQRIRVGKDRAKDENRLVQDGEVQTACQQTCPTQAIVFGNILDPESRVKKWSEDHRGYRVFDELGARPYVTYLHPEHA